MAPRLLAPGRRAILARESLLGSLPALAGLAGLAAAGVVEPAGLAAGWLAGLAVAAFLADARLRRLEAAALLVEELADALPGSGSNERPAMGSGAAVPGRLTRPLAELSRRIGRDLARAAAQERVLASVIEAAPDPVLLVDAGLEVVRANAAARRDFRVGEGPMPVPLARVLRDPGVLAATTAALQAGAPSTVTFSPTLDRLKEFTARVEPVDLGEGGPGVLLAFRERTEQVMIERMRSDFVANASHEIRNPLAAIQGIVETLRGPARDDAGARDMFLELMAGEAARMARLVDDLLSLSRVELAANQPPTGRCDLRAVMGQVVERMYAVAAPSAVRIEAAIPSSLPEVVGDADQLHQLLVNLVDNAVKYGGEGTLVRVEATALAAAPAEAGPVAGRPCVRVAVRDQGPGIAREHIPRLTERFYRVDTARSRKLRGTGLGLAIVKHIVRRHQGHLAIESEPGRGSTFAVLLPAATARGTGSSPARAPCRHTVTEVS